MCVLFLLISGPAAVTIARADEHQLPERTGIDNVARFQERRMEAMIEPNLDDAPVFRGSGRDRLRLCKGAARRLLDQYVPPGFDRADRDAGELIVRRRDDH